MHQPLVTEMLDHWPQKRNPDGKMAMDAILMRYDAIDTIAICFTFMKQFVLVSIFEAEATMVVVLPVR